jgi:hypothetical protein
MFVKRNSLGIVQIVACCSLALFSASQAMGDSTTLDPTKDSWLSENSGSSNYGSASYLLFGNLGSSGTDCHLIVQYDVSSIPSNATITDVALIFHKTDGSSTLAAGLRRNISYWSESTVTFSNYSPGILVGSTSINGSNTYPLASAPSLVSTVQGWVDGSYTNYGIMIEAVAASDYLSFYSREGAGYPIRLVVEYTASSGNPDLVVENMSVSNTNPTAGQNFTASAVVRNQGSATSDSTTLRYYQSSNSTISTGDTQLSTDGVSSLTPGATSSESDSVSIPTAGTYWIGACVDPVPDESNTSNNCSSGVQVTVVSGGCTDDGYESQGSGGSDDSCWGASTNVPGSQAHLHCDEDWVTFTSVAGATYRIETSSLVGGADTVISLHQDCGAVLVSNDDYNGLASRVEWTTPSAAPMDIRITEYSSDYQDGEGYTVTVTCLSGCGADHIFSDGFESGNLNTWSSSTEAIGQASRGPDTRGDRQLSK